MKNFERFQMKSVLVAAALLLLQVPVCLGAKEKSAVGQAEKIAGGETTIFDNSDAERTNIGGLDTGAKKGAGKGDKPTGTQKEKGTKDKALAPGQDGTGGMRTGAAITEKAQRAKSRDQGFEIPVRKQEDERSGAEKAYDSAKKGVADTYDNVKKGTANAYETAKDSPKAIANLVSNPKDPSAAADKYAYDDASDLGGTPKQNLDRVKNATDKTLKIDEKKLKQSDGVAQDIVKYEQAKERASSLLAQVRNECNNIAEPTKADVNFCSSQIKNLRRKIDSYDSKLAKLRSMR